MFPVLDFFLVIEFPARKTLPIILKLCLRESTESVATPRYPVFFSTTSELGDMSTGAWHGCPGIFLKYFLSNS